MAITEGECERRENWLFSGEVRGQHRNGIAASINKIAGALTLGVVVSEVKGPIIRLQP